MVLTSELLDRLSQEAKTSERLRMNLDLRNSTADQSQRMLNALEPGTRVPVHRHQDTNETIVMLRGSIRELFFDEAGQITEEILLRANAEPSAMNIPAGAWHTLECLEPGTILLEMKDGPFVPRQPEDEKPQWNP
ncbi:MAG: WbuC family cupin fold metalloprotein [Bacteroidaceae bacterium]|nr:WbuC family cupin fold metalloprotein [Bacteroidaceae bacterium]